MMIKRKFENLDLRAIGNELEIVGVVYGSDKEYLVILLPGESVEEPLQMMLPSLEEWTQIVKQSDVKEVEGMAKGQKIILRKSTRQIEQKVMWEVFRRDNFQCRYCGTVTAPLTVDHVVLWEEMGPSIPMNLISSCKKCNNKRGNMRYQDWLMSPYYLSKIGLLGPRIIAANGRVIADIPIIKERHLRSVKRSR